MVQLVLQRYTGEAGAGQVMQVQFFIGIGIRVKS